MSRDQKLDLFLGLTVFLGTASLPAAFFLFPPAISQQWLLALVTLLALAVLGSILALKITEGGSTTSMEFVPQLGAVPLLGPFGAIIVALVTQFFTEFLLLRKPPKKAVFNTAQVMLSVAAASFVYVAFGATPGLESLSFSTTFPPFLVGVVAYFAINTIAVSYVISLAEDRQFLEVWQRTAGSIIVFDLAISPLAYLVAFLYVRWGAVALLAAIVPIIGLRYSYGVNIELHQLSQDLLRVLIKTLEARDRYTSGHSVRVAERSKKIARMLRLGPRDVRVIETAALLHDIGKIDLAYGEILRQTGPLDPEQRQLIRAHPDKGVEIIQAVRSLDPEILRCVRHHHEWFDGSGYPAGISGEKIPLGARIIMISDSVDAMLTDRPYRAALSIEDVRQELVRNTGVQFDPAVVKAAFDAAILEDAESQLQLTISPGEPRAPAAN
jgi:putative nucleotidyltransferase with HDIG domain